MCFGAQGENPSHHVLPIILNGLYQNEAVHVYTKKKNYSIEQWVFAVFKYLLD